MEGRKMIPIGVENFEELMAEDFYYVDKTGMIRDLLNHRGKVTLFTRPRRFGKSLNMSMLKHFFSAEGNKSIFDGLTISKETELCEKHMGKYPVISISLKEIEGKDYESAYRKIARLMRATANEAYELMDSDKLNEVDKADYRALLDLGMTEDTLCSGLMTLCKLLEKHYGKKTVLLIDEYDVPLQRAFINGYYDQMVSLIRGMFGAALKTNDSLDFAVLTGCLRVAKESIFTGMNNLEVFSITDKMFSQYFGFTDGEVREILAYYGIGKCYGALKDWYDGYQFGGTEIYCPWDVLNHSKRFAFDQKTAPQNYWIDTSGNDVIKRFVAQATDATREEIERLIAGEAIEKEVRLNLTYSEMYDSIENLWSLLFMTGYLTERGDADGRRRKLAIPNQEVRDIFVMQIQEYFKESVKSDTDTLDAFCAALVGGDADEVGRLFSQYLEQSISIRDAAAPDDRKESFYHGTMLGILMASGRMSVVSNREAGNGFADILAKSKDGETGIVIEMKYARDGDLDGASQDAIGQIDERQYMDAFKYTLVRKVLKYGVGCYKKTCRVVLGE